MDNFPNNLNDENKIFLPLNNRNEECKWLTIGIGDVTNSERLFKMKYPNCAVYGVEPSSPGNFSNVGKVIPYGIGFNDNDAKISMKVNGTYIEQNFKVLSLTTVLDKYIHSRFVHYLTIDIEGFEYKILEQLVGSGNLTEEKTGIVFCQIDAELHNPQMHNAHSAVRNILNPVEFMLNFLQDSSPFIPIFNAPYTHHPHQKVTFINIENPECEAAFGFTSFFNHV
uniref:Methyltransferase FkbM domain-containing protein n=1 Tax=Panagrolaimus davidi TaxID=227884 RepID=A0A914QP01_9BILA